MIGANILLVEDEGSLRKLVATYFIRERVNIKEAGDGERALELWEKNNFDLVILDIMLPHYDGWTICKRIRATSNVPIIMLTARSEESDKLFGFEVGADDYITKPFSVKELVARAKALLKRTNHVLLSETLEVGDLRIEKKSHEVFMKNQLLQLTPKEYDLLIFLLHHKKQVLSREMILDGVWGYDYYGDLRTVDTHVKRLRQKLQDMGGNIKTVRGVGYCFEVKV